MNILNEYFDQVIWIGSQEHRPDRAFLMRAQLAKWDIDALYFNGHWKPIDHLGKENANFGCTSSHRSVLGYICLAGFERTLVLEDDCLFVDDQWPEMFAEMVKEVPADWDFLFLGASYAEDPKYRVSGSVIRTNGLMTTSSFGITLAQARKMAPYIGGEAAIDTLYQKYQREGKSFIFDPRICVQRAGLSNIQGIEIDPGQSMLDRSHLERLDAQANLDLGNDCI